MENTGHNEGQGLGRYLSPLAVWALSFGCAVGWGAFVMPGTTFLPAAGPLGTALGIGIGAAIMFIIGVNYHYLMNKFPDAGGTLTYAVRSFGYDHGFLSAWFLALVYIAIIWANATALALIARNTLCDAFQFGFHYQILDYEVYLGEALLSIAAILLFGAICIYSKRLAVHLQTILALVLFGGILLCFFAVQRRGGGAAGGALSAFAYTGRPPFQQVSSIVALSPWAFVGFESVSNSAAGFRFSAKRSIWIMGAALLAGAAAYILLARLSIAILPEGYGDWESYIADLPNLEGLAAFPAFFAVHAALGEAGILLLGLTVTAAIITGLVGNYIAASRLLYSMAEGGLLPRWFMELNKDGSPKNALLFLMAVSVPVPFLGRTAIGWIIDVNTIGATIAYGYTSAAAFFHARKEGRRGILLSGGVGVLAAAVFFLYFMAWSAGRMATESYLILASWSILGFVFFRYVFSRDEKRRFGKSTVVWIGLLFLIFFTTLMWVDQATDKMTASIVHNVSAYYEDAYYEGARYEEQDPEGNSGDNTATERFLAQQMAASTRIQTRNSMIQMGFILASLAIMFNLYTTISKREKQMEVEKTKAEESSKAKSTFLFNMSHDIRTPMNAIIGYINLAEHDGNDLATMREYLGKIKTSSQHLLALINDVLEMSRIESGKIDLEPIPVDLKKTLAEVKDMFSTQMEVKEIDFRVDSSQVRDSRVYCDKNRLNRVLLNLLSNAYKFTPQGGTVTISLWQIGDGQDGIGKYELRVSDSGIGMTAEFAAKVFEAFERERTSTVSGIQGTGLGMAITKSIIDLMGGSIEVHTAPGQGTEFVIRLSFPLQEKEAAPERWAGGAVEGGDAHDPAAGTAVDFSKMRLLLVEDIEINREIAVMLLTEMGFTVETAENGQEAVDKVSGSQPGYFDGVLMDIQMPVMDGYDASRAIRELESPGLSRLPIIAMTANAFSEDVKKALDAGMDAHIAKPIDVGLMHATLQEVLGQRRRTSGAVR